MKKSLLLLFGMLTILFVSAQVTITTSTTHDKYQVIDGSYRTDVPLGSTYIDVNSSGNVALKTMGTDKLIVNYKTPADYTINGVVYSNLDSCIKYLSLATTLQLEYLVSNISGGGGGVSTLNDKDGGVKIVAGSNITVDNSKADTIVISSNFDGDYIPFHVKNNAVVTIDSSISFQGVNHSFGLNKSFNALEIGGANLDGVMAQNGSIYTMTGNMKIPLFNGNDTRYPMMFISDGLPFVDPVFKYGFLKMDLVGGEPAAMFNFNDQDEDGPTIGVNKLGISLNGGLSLMVNGEIYASSYIEGKTANHYAQVQDLAWTTIVNPPSPLNLNVTTKEVYLVIEADSSQVILPDISECEFLKIYIVNKSSTEVRFSTTSEQNVFWEGGSTSTFLDVYDNGTATILFDGTNYVLF